MTFTKTIPTKPGFYAWRFNRNSSSYPVEVTKELWELWCISPAGDSCKAFERGGEWCRLVPASDYVPKEELKKAYAEAWSIPDFIDPEDAWNSSRAKKVMEGEL